MAQVDSGQAALLAMEAALKLARAHAIDLNGNHRNLFDGCKTTDKMNDDLDKIMNKIDSALRVKKHLHECFVKSPVTPTPKIGT